jgi:hypothetical protein
MYDRTHSVCNLHENYSGNRRASGFAFMDNYPDYIAVRVSPLN